MVTILKNEGFCPVCSSETVFLAEHTWLRDNYFCTKCGSIPRERALMRVIDSFYPAWRDLVIHETSPGNRGASARLASECKNYIPSHYFADIPGGSFKDGIRCENLEKLNFSNQSVDLHVSQDVIEHIFSPESAFAEIGRTLKPGGAHIFTVPIVNKYKPSHQRAAMSAEGTVKYIDVPQYHGNPIDAKGSLVTFDWGYDICNRIFEASGLFTYVIQIDDLSNGIRAEYIDVLVTMKNLDEPVRDEK